MLLGRGGRGGRGGGEREPMGTGRLGGWEKRAKRTKPLPGFLAVNKGLDELIRRRNRETTGLRVSVLGWGREQGSASCVLDDSAGSERRESSGRSPVNAPGTVPESGDKGGFRLEQQGTEAIREDFHEGSHAPPKTSSCLQDHGSFVRGISS